MLKQHPDHFALHWPAAVTPLFTDLTGHIDTGHWRRQLDTVISYCKQQPGSRVLLFQPDCYLFSLWFCALAHLGKTIFLAPNSQPDTLQQLQHETDWQVPEKLPVLTENTPYSDCLTFSADTQVIFFTSGSTGTPKLVVRQLSQLLIEVSTLEQHFGSKLPANTVFAATVSHQHIYGLLFRILWPLSYGYRLHRPQLNYFEQWQQLLPSGDMILIASPAHLSRFEEIPQLTANQHHLHAIFSSGGPLADHLPAFYYQHLGLAPLEIFGSTETGGIAYRQRPHGYSAWQAFSNITLALSADSRLIIRSPYVNNNADYQTQDIAELLADNRFELSGRADRIVKVEEKRLSLIELEQYCLQHPLVNAAAALVLPEGLAGNRAQLAVVLALTTEGLQQLEQQGPRTISQLLKQHLLQRFEQVLLPKRFRYVAQLPYNEQGKLPRQQLESLFSDG